MCGESADQVYLYKLYQGKRYISRVEKRLAVSKKQAQGFLDSLKYRKFCCHACASNYNSWQKTHEDKNTYTKEHFFCQFCAQESDGGRIIIKFQRDDRLNLKMCKKCHRRQITKIATAKWEKSHPENVRERRKRFNLLHPEKCREYKEKQAKRIGKQYGRKEKAWAIHYNYCVKCGKNIFPHHGKGLCKKCYAKRI